jgi:FAD-dependent urate hydroxylase
MKVVIIGAGIGGAATALILSRAGHDVEVYEQAPELRAGGNGVILLPNATALLRELGMDAGRLGTRLDVLDLLTADGRPLMHLRMDKISREYGEPTMVCERGAVLRKLAGALPDGCVRFGAACEDITDAGGKVVASFSNGSKIECDLLIGADGHRSVVRRHLFGSSEAGYTGDATWHGITELPGEFPNGHRMHTLYGAEGMCIIHPVGDGKVYWAFEVPWSDGDVVPPGRDGDHAPEEGNGAGPPSPMANLRDRFGHWTASILPQLLASVTDEDVSVFPHILHELPQEWGRGSITLVGDAAHVVPPRVGMGLAQALEDAWMLGRALERPGPVTERLRAYEKARMVRVAKMHSLAAAMGRKTLPLPLWLVRSIGRWLPITRYQSAQIKRLSSYLNDDRPLVGG